MIEYLFIFLVAIILMLFALLQVMVTNVTSLLKTVKSVEDEASRGTRALESTIEALGQEIRVGLSVQMLLEFSLS